MRNNRVLFMVETSIFAVLALLFDLFNPLKLWPQGGSISFAMVPIFIIAFRWGLKGGLTAGFLYGLLQLIIDPFIVTPIQVFVDYFLAFTVLGIAGVFAKQTTTALQEHQKKKAAVYIIAGTFIGSLARFAAHFISGVTFFAEAAPAGTPVALYSLSYNGSYMLPSFLLSAIITWVVLSSVPRLAIVKHT